MRALRTLVGLFNALLILAFYLFFTASFIIIRLLVWKRSWFSAAIYKVYNLSTYIWRFIIYKTNSIKIHFAGDEINRNDTALVISNHVQTLDMGTISILANKYGPGCGPTRYIVKQSVFYVPFFGLVHWFLGDAFLKRKWEQDEKMLRHFSENFIKVPNKWLVLFPEGTRASGRGKVEACQKFADEHGLPRLNYVLYPRSKGFVTMAQGLQKAGVRYVYDLTLLYPAKSLLTTPKTWKMMCGGNKFELVCHLKRLELSSIPRDEKGINEWLYKRFQIKEAMYQSWVASDFNVAKLQAQKFE